MNGSTNMGESAVLVTPRLMTNSKSLELMSSIIDLTGRRYSRLTVVKCAPDYISPAGKPAVRWECVCDCGKTTVVLRSVLTSQNTRSCGCLHMEALSRKKENNGVSCTPEYRVWWAMVDRCTNPRSHNWSGCGGRGISVDQSWIGNPAQFVADMGPRPSPKHTLDRIDVNGDYTSSNCRWATPKEQGRNRKNNKIVVYEGVEYVLSELAEKLNIPRGVFAQRIYSMNWAPENWSKPVRRCKSHRTTSTPSN